MKVTANDGNSEADWTRHFSAMASADHHPQVSTLGVGASKHRTADVYHVGGTSAGNSSTDQVGSGSHPLIKLVSPIAQTVDQAKAEIKRDIKRSASEPLASQPKIRRRVNKSSAGQRKRAAPKKQKKKKTTKKQGRKQTSKARTQKTAAKQKGRGKKGAKKAASGKKVKTKRAAGKKTGVKTVSDIFS